MVERLADLGRDARGIALPCALFGKGDEGLLGRGESFAGFLGVFVAQIVEREVEGLGKAEGLGDGLRMAPEEACHLGGRLQVAFGVGLEVEAGAVEGRVLADAGERVLELPACWRVVERVSHGDHGDPVLRC